MHLIQYFISESILVLEEKGLEVEVVEKIPLPHTHTHTSYKGRSHKLQWTYPCLPEFLCLRQWHVYIPTEHRSGQRTDNIEPQWWMPSCAQAVPSSTHILHYIYSHQQLYGHKSIHTYCRYIEGCSFTHMQRKRDLMHKSKHKLVVLEHTLTTSQWLFVHRWKKESTLNNSSVYLF